jgi:hypothetical protein
VRNQPELTEEYEWRKHCTQQERAIAIGKPTRSNNFPNTRLVIALAPIAKA